MQCAGGPAKLAARRRVPIDRARIAVDGGRGLEDAGGDALFVQGEISAR